MTARQAALAALKRCRKDGAWSEEALDSAIRNGGLDSRDAALAYRICMGTIQNRQLCDFYIDCYSSVKSAKLEPVVLDILRMSVYQLIFMDRIPAHAVVSEAVDLCSKSGSKKASGLVNAVLRRVSENKNSLPEPDGTDAHRIAVKYSHPEWLAQELIERSGIEFAESFFAANNAPAPVTVRVNTTKCSLDELIDSMKEQGVSAEKHTDIPNFAVVSLNGSIERLDAFKNGLFHVQDCAAAMAVTAADPKPGDSLLDVCAAPGGKSFAAAVTMNNNGRIVSCDINDKKLKRIDSGALRLGIDIIATRAMDGRTPDKALFGNFDVVLTDVPCSGLGVIRKKPEIRDRSREEIDRLPEIQYNILKGAANCVADGGVLVYSTCTIRECENEAVVRRFLAECSDFAPEEFTLPGSLGKSEQGMFTFWPNVHGTDGFFVCKLRKH